MKGFIGKDKKETKEAEGEILDVYKEKAKGGGG